MGTQRFNAKKVRRMAEATGEPLTRAWTREHGSAYVATLDHRHGVYYFDHGIIVWQHPVAGHLDTCYQNGVLLEELEPWA